MSYEEVDESTDREGDGTWGVRRRDRRPIPSPRNEDTAVEAVSSATVLQEDVSTQLALASFSGPLPDPGTLAGYNSVVPGSAQRIIDAHLTKEYASAHALTRLTRAESTAVATGAIGAQVLTIGGLVCAVGLLVAGFPSGAIAAIFPAILGGAAQVVSAFRRKD